MKTQTILTTWFPRVLAIIFIAFLVLLSFDVFSLNGSVLEKMGGFLVENIPAILLVIALVLAWKKPITGGAIFVVMGIIFTIFYRTYQRWDTFVLISVPLLLIGFLFLLNKNEHN
jgi:hypothetical protein